jgi:hypothetical protein
MGIRNWACRLFSNNKGAIPAIVVREVRKIALNLALPAS